MQRGGAASESVQTCSNCNEQREETWSLRLVRDQQHSCYSFILFYCHRLWVSFLLVDCGEKKIQDELLSVNQQFDSTLWSAESNTLNLQLSQVTVTTGTQCRRVDICVFELRVSDSVFPLRLKMSGYEEEEEDRAESPGFSCVSLKSDRSMAHPFNFSKWTWTLTHKVRDLLQTCEAPNWILREWTSEWCVLNKNMFVFAEVRTTDWEQSLQGPAVCLWRVTGPWILLL